MTRFLPSGASPRRAFAATLASCLCVAAVHADPPTREDLDFFESKIRPILVDNCFKCHSAGVKIKAHLRLDSRDLILKGGDTSPALVPGHPEKSLLVKAISYTDPELRMPPRGKMPDQAIALLTEWVKRGAPWPEEKTVAKGPKKDFDLKERSKHWSLQPLASPVPPAVAKKDWPTNDIDHFILAALEAKKLSPASPTDKRTLLRRVTFDLTGLPPTPAEIDAFLKDDAPDAYEKVVDRLLASPHYGERWARHWLDLVRYAETYGHEFDFEIPDAWLYRDYLIRAFNADVPFNRFVMEAIAGDALNEPRRHPADKTNESALGTMFWLFGEAKHSPVDSKGDYSDRLDNQIDVFGKTFLGMTIACARCHDHKFDAISTKDYYALYGYLESSWPTRAFLDDPAPRRAWLKTARTLREDAARLSIRQFVEQIKLKGRYSLYPVQKLFGDPLAVAKKDEDRPPRWQIVEADFAARKANVLAKLEAQQKRYDAALSSAGVFADAARDNFAAWIASGESFAELPATPPLVLDFTTPLGVGRFKPASRVSAETAPELQGAFRSPTFTITKKKIHYRASGHAVRINLILDGLQLIQDPIYGGLKFTVNTKPASAPLKGWDPKTPLPQPEPLRELAWHTQDVSMWLGHRAYIEILDDGPGSITLDQVVFSDDGPPPERPNRLLLSLLRDAKTFDALDTAYVKLVDETLDLLKSDKLAGRADYADRAEILNDLLIGSLWTGRASYGPIIFPTKERAPYQKEWEAIFDRARKLASGLPAPRRALALCDGSPVNESVFIRGGWKTPGEVVPRRFLEVFGGKTPGPDEKGSGRLELARQMTDPKQTPILPRVIVNRLWKHHFGRGIVPTVDDFGVLGQAPSHPELLDWLAQRFIADGWSIKKMHRLMLLSATYRMSSVSTKEADAADPDNRLWHRMPIRRLEAEAIRDSLLAVSGRLDLKMLGPPVPTHLTPYMVGRGRPGVSGPLDGAGRRSIYLSIRRNFLNPMFLAFDFPTPFSTMGRRGVSNVPAQALTMLNNPLVLQQAELWAKETLKTPGLDAKGRIERMYVQALGRPPQAPERDAALAFIGAREDAAAWTELAHVLFNVKEFIYVN
ncbi:MAG: PSD1 and planctomycete cytochrome C domain-containing protein [Gemmataceae bacterium]